MHIFINLQKKEKIMTTSTAETLASFSLFSSISIEKLEKFVSVTSISQRSFEVGRMIFIQNTVCENLHLLVRGKARAVMMNADGKQVTIEEINSPRIIAPAALFASTNVFPVNIVAVSDCSILFIPKNDFLNLMRQEPSVMSGFIELLSDKSIFLSMKINSFALQTLKERLASYLLSEDERHTQKEVAEMLGVTRPSLARVLAELADEGCIAIRNRKIEILDKKKLESASR